MHALLRSAGWMGISLVLVSCAAPSRQRFEKQISQDIGQPISQIIKRMGEPAHITDAPDGGKTYSFLQSQSHTTPTSPIDARGTTSEDDNRRTKPGAYFVIESCRIDYIVNAQQKITAYRFDEDRCVGETPR